MDQSRSNDNELTEVESEWTKIGQSELNGLNWTELY